MTPTAIAPTGPGAPARGARSASAWCSAMPRSPTSATCRSSTRAIPTSASSCPTTRARRRCRSRRASTRTRRSARSASAARRRPIRPTCCAGASRPSRRTRRRHGPLLITTLSFPASPAFVALDRATPAFRTFGGVPTITATAACSDEDGNPVLQRTGAPGAASAPSATSTSTRRRTGLRPEDVETGWGYGTPARVVNGARAARRRSSRVRSGPSSSESVHDERRHADSSTTLSFTPQFWGDFYTLANVADGTNAPPHGPAGHQGDGAAAAAGTHVHRVPDDAHVINTGIDLRRSFQRLEEWRERPCRSPSCSVPAGRATWRTATTRHRPGHRSDHRPGRLHRHRAPGRQRDLRADHRHQDDLHRSRGADRSRSDAAGRRTQLTFGQRADDPRRNPHESDGADVRPRGDVHVDLADHLHDHRHATARR